MKDVLKAFHSYVEKKYNAEAGFITMNLPKLQLMLEEVGIERPIICTSINKAGFRMSGGKELYESVLKSKEVRIIAMQVFAGGALSAREAIKYIYSLPNIESILFGASSQGHITETVSLIQEYEELYKVNLSVV